MEAGIIDLRTHDQGMRPGRAYETVSGAQGKPMIFAPYGAPIIGRPTPGSICPPCPTLSKTLRPGDPASPGLTKHRVIKRDSIENLNDDG